MTSILRLSHVSVFLAAGGLALLIACFYFAQPTVDDFCKAANGRSGALEAVRQTYLRSSGRWSTNLVQAALFSRVDLVAFYPLLLVSVWLFHGASVFSLGWAIFRRHLAVSQIAAGTVLFLLISWTAMRQAGDFLFWITGSIEYLFSASIAIFLFALLLGGSSGVLGRVLSVVLAIYSAGSHELIASAALVLLVAGTLTKRRAGGRDWRLWLALSVVMAAGLSVLVLSPGAAARASRVSGSFNFLLAAGITVSRWILLAPSWLLQAPVLIASLWILATGRFAPVISAMNFTRREMATHVAVWVLIVTSTFFIPALGLGSLVPARVLCIACLIFLLGWFWLVGLASAEWPVFTRIPDRERERMGSGLVLLLCASILYSPMARTTAAVLVNGAPAWNRASRLRYAAMEAESVAGRRNVVVNPIPPTPSVYFDNPISGDPKFRANRCAANYFGLETVRTDSAQPGNGGMTAR